MKFVKTLALAVVTLMLVTTCVHAQKNSSSKPSGSSSSSKPPSSSGGSKPMFGNGTQQSKPTVSPPASNHATTPPPADKSKPMFGNGSTKSTTPPASDAAKPKFGAAGSGNTSSSAKPTGGGGSMADANKKEVSKRVYAEQKAATAPPKTEAVVGGKTVKVDTSSPGLKDLRSKPVDYIRPERRIERTNTIIIERNHYHHPYNYYASQPTFYVGGGYSSAFWYIMMMEWSAERRADWLYNNQSRISQDAYNQGMKDAQVQARLAVLEIQNTPRNVNYVDKDFKEDPSLQYDQSYVEAVYNPTVTEVPVAQPKVVIYNAPFPWGTVLLSVLVIGGVVVIIYIVAFKRTGE